MSEVELKSRIAKKIRAISDKRMLAELDLLVGDMKAMKGKDFWDELSSENKKLIEQSRKEIKEGKVATHEEVQREVLTWLKR